MLSTEARVRKLQTLLDRVQARGSRLGAPSATPWRAPALAKAPAAAPAAPAKPPTDAFNTVPPPAGNATVPPPPEATTQPPVAPSVAPAPVQAHAPRAMLPEPVVTHAKLAGGAEVPRFVGSVPSAKSAGEILAQALLS